MGESPEPKVVSGPDSVNTMADLGRELRRRRIEAGFATLPELLRNAKGANSLPKSTAYNLEAGKSRCNWISVEAHLRACGAENAEITDWHDAYDRAVLHYSGHGTPDSERISVPTAKQLAEMGSEQAGQILSEIDFTQAATLLRRISIQQAVAVLPVLSPDIAVALLVEMTQARTILVFENIDPERGAELLSEMRPDHIMELLAELDAACAGALLAAMPRIRAVGLLNTIDKTRSIRMIAEMPPKRAAKLLSELDPELVAAVVRTADVGKVAKLLDRVETHFAAVMLAGGLSEDRALELLGRVSKSTGQGVLDIAMRQELPKVSDWARQLLAKLPVDRLSEFFEQLNFGFKARLLSDYLEPARAAELLMKHEEELVLLLDEVRPERAAVILLTMERCEAALQLASLPRSTSGVILQMMPPAQADQLRGELAPANLARYLAELDSDRSAMYLRFLDDRAGDIFRQMDQYTALRVLRGVAVLSQRAEIFNQMDASQVADMMLDSENWEMAHILADMLPERAILSLAEMEPETVESILAAMEKPADDDESPLVAERRRHHQDMASLLRRGLVALRNRDNDVGSTGR